MEALAEVVSNAVRDGLPGVGLRVVRAGQRFEVVAGVADEAGTPLTADSVGRYYSSAKVVTSVVVMQLVEEGLLDLGTSLAELLPEWSNVDNSPTVFQLLTHTAGLTYGDASATSGSVEASYVAVGINHEGEMSLETFSTKVAAQAPCFSPGAQWRYSIAHDMLGRVIEVAAGRSLDELAAARIFEPLGMGRTSFRAGDLVALLGTCWNHQPGSDPQVVLADKAGARSDFMNPRRMLSGGGGLLSTLEDFTRLCEALLRGGDGIVTPESVDAILSDQLPPQLDGPDPGIGFGFGGLVTRVGASPWPQGVFSWGGYAGTQFLIDQPNELVVCLHMQVQHDFTISLWHELVAALYQ